MPTLLTITDLHVSVEGKPILNGVSLSINEGETHAIMGPNGSGKSTLANTLMGHPKYEVTGGSVSFRGEDVLAMSPDERAKAGLFLAFQYPREIAGVSLRSFLFAAYNALQAHSESQRLSPMQFKTLLEKHMEELHMDPTFAERPVNQGFSGGEKKKAEILQLSILQPSLALLDETDSGLDVDALKIVAQGIHAMREKKPEKNQPAFSALLVTHYARILSYLKPDHVHVMVGGRIVQSGDSSLALALEESGYERFETSKTSPTRIALEDRSVRAKPLSDT